MGIYTYLTSVRPSSLQHFFFTLYPITPSESTPLISVWQCQSKREIMRMPVYQECDSWRQGIFTLSLVCRRTPPQNCCHALKITWQPLSDLFLLTALTATLPGPWNASDKRLKREGIKIDRSSLRKGARRKWKCSGFSSWVHFAAATGLEGTRQGAPDSHRFTDSKPLPCRSSLARSFSISAFTASTSGSQPGDVISLHFTLTLPSSPLPVHTSLTLVNSMWFYGRLHTSCAV